MSLMFVSLIFYIYTENKILTSALIAGSNFSIVVASKGFCLAAFLGAAIVYAICYGFLSIYEYFEHNDYIRILLFMGAAGLYIKLAVG